MDSLASMIVAAAVAAGFQFASSLPWDRSQVADLPPIPLPFHPVFRTAAPRWLSGLPLAQAGGAAPGGVDLWSLVLPVLILVALLLVLALGVAAAKSWYKKSQASDENDELLTDFRMLRDQGELSPEEYQKIVQRLSQRPSLPSRPAKETPAPPTVPPNLTNEATPMDDE